MTTTTEPPVSCLPDLDSRAQIHDLVVRFYREIVFDELLAPVFVDVAEVDWAVHIPRLIDFWCRVLLGHPGYDGFVLGAHQQVHEIEAFRPELFDRWYELFIETIDGGWSGPISESAKQHAARVAATLSRRLLDRDWRAPTAERMTRSDEGGDSACWSHLVCPGCGQLADEGHRPECEQRPTLPLTRAQDSRAYPSINPEAGGPR
jgi:hemoglobin